MTDRDLIDGLIATYRDLNLRVRPQSEERLRLRGTQGAVRDVITHLRDDELIFSQTIKDTIAGLPVVEMNPDDAPVLGTESEHDTTATILAQFGTARESTLAMLRALPADQWDARTGSVPTMRERATQRLANDRASMERVVALLGSPV
jgi:hypothetical protein